MKEEWNDQDAAGLSRYISTHPKFMEELTGRLPEIITTGTMEQGAMSGARNAGGNDILKAIKDMQGIQGDVRTTEYIDPSKDN